MAENPFTKFQKYVDRPGRSSKDLSYDVNGTYRIGTITPVGLWEVNPGDSFKIRSAFGLKFLPMPFPIQTRLRANLYYYYVRNRNIYDGWKDFAYNNKTPAEVPHPFITRPATDREFWKTGGIMDHLGVPTTIVKKNHAGVVSVGVWGISFRSLSSSPLVDGTNSGVASGTNPSMQFSSEIYTSQTASSVALRGQFSRPVMIWPKVTPKDGIPGYFPGLPGAEGDVAFGKTYSRCLVSGSDIESTSSLSPYETRSTGYNTGVFFQPPVMPVEENETTALDFFNVVPGTLTSDVPLTITIFAGDPSEVRSSVSSDEKSPLASFVNMGFEHVTGDLLAGTTTFRVGLTRDLCASLAGIVGNGQCYFLHVGMTEEDKAKSELTWIADALSQLLNSSPNLGNLCQMSVFATEVVDIADYPSMNPFAGPNPSLPLSALPLRVYESIYNAWFRNERLNPLRIDGVPEYNKFCPNTGDGADDYPYRLYQRNWESDFLTSALPTPQQGVAPVVGVTGLSTIQIDDDGTIRNFSATVAEDGETITGGSFTEPGASSGAKRTIAEMVQAGFTINDLRNVSALQRWVENNIRRGLKYRDQVLANTGVKVRYDELDMPEFIGGFSRPVNVSAITQTAPGGEVGVGDYAGQANSFGESKHSVTHYCDEAGFIMAVLCLVPEPVYSQTLPKFFLKESPLDYFHPAFNHIGMQPISMAEVAPLQVFNANPSQTSDGPRFSDVFGYQRPWYDLVARVNEVHGLMRTSMRDYVMNRTFDDVPELGQEFVEIDPEQINDVFSVTLPDQDVCMGQIIHQCYCKNMVSLFGQPKIQ